MITEKARRSVVRLLDRGFNEADVLEIFLFIRDKKRHGGRATIRDVGDLIAHGEERTMGALRDSARDCATILYFSARQIANIDTKSGIRPPLNTSKLPPEFFEVMEATERQLDKTTLYERTRMNRSNVQKFLKNLKPYFLPNGDGTYTLAAPPTATFQNVLTGLTGTIISKPAYNDDRLFKELSSALQAQNILTQNEVKKFSLLKPAVSLFAISRMHNVEIDIGIPSARHAKLIFNNNLDGKGEWSPDRKEYLVHLTRVGVGITFYDLPTSAGPGGCFILSAFDTKLNAIKYCETSLLNSTTIYEGDIRVRTDSEGIPKLYLVD